MKFPHKRLLLVDDDHQLCQLLSEYLTGVGFAADAINDSEQAIAVLTAEHAYDAVVLDIMMPKVSGLEVLQAVRRHSDTAVIMLTGRGDDVDRIVGLELGADDYLAKPCNPRELAARLNAVLRRTATDATSANRSLTGFGLRLNPKTLEVEAKGQMIVFTQAEFRVLHLLMQHTGQTLTKAFLTEKVLKRPLSPHDRSIDVHISRVRQKLAAQAGLHAIIKAVRGIGYQMIEDSD